MVHEEFDYIYEFLNTDIMELNLPSATTDYQYTKIANTDWNNCYNRQYLTQGHNGQISISHILKSSLKLTWLSVHVHKCSNSDTWWKWKADLSEQNSTEWTYFNHKNEAKQNQKIYKINTGSARDCLGHSVTDTWILQRLTCSVSRACWPSSAGCSSDLCRPWFVSPAPQRTSACACGSPWPTPIVSAWVVSLCQRLWTLMSLAQSILLTLSMYSTWSP